MTINGIFDGVFKVVVAIYLGIATIFAAPHLLSAMDSKSAMVHRCADRNANNPTFLSGILVMPALIGLGWPITFSTPLYRPYDNDCRF